MFENPLVKFRVVNYLLSVFILLAVLLLARNIVSVSFSKKEARHTIHKNNVSIKTNKNDIMQYSAILEKNPFGQPMKLHPIEGKQEAELSLGSLSNLVLIGTVSGPESISYAIFEDKSQPNVQEIFGYREAVFNYGVLTRITMTSVDIVQDSQTFTLTFPSDEAVIATENRAYSTPAETPQTSFARKVGEQEYILDSRKVQQSLENPEQILTDARLLPNFVDGKQAGFKISEVIPDGLYGSLGIKNGDVLLRVNGLEISNPEVAIQAMSSLKGMNRVNLDLIRNGKNMSMSYQIR
jgi:general secretion pathway protein C